MRLRYTARLANWRWIVLAAGASLALLRSERMPADIFQTAVVVIVALALASALDDPAANILAASPTSLLRRRMLRISVAVPLAAAAVTPPLWLRSLPPETAALEAVVLFAVVLVLAAWELRTAPDGRAGGVAGGLLLVSVASLTMLPRALRVYPVEAHEWRWLLIGGVAVLALWRGSADAAGRRLLA